MKIEDEEIKYFKILTHNSDVAIHGILDTIGLVEPEFSKMINETRNMYLSKRSLPELRNTMDRLIQNGDVKIVIHNGLARCVYSDRYYNEILDRIRFAEL